MMLRTRKVKHSYGFVFLVFVSFMGNKGVYMKVKKNNIAFTAIFMSSATLLAKFCGLLRDMILASMYGTESAEAIAFSTASRIPLLFFDIALGTAVTSAFIPIFNEYLERKEEKMAMQFANRFSNLIIFVTLIISVIGIVFSNQFIYIIAGDIPNNAFMLASDLMKILFPTIIFTGLAFCFVGILQSYGEFNIPAIISLVSNGFLILYLLFVGNRLGVAGVAVAMLVAWGTQVIVQIPSLKRFKFRFSPSLRFNDDGIKKVAKLALPIIISTWVQPINTMINMRLSSGLNGGAAIPALDYANKIYIILVGVFTFTITNIVFPRLSRAATSRNNEEYKATVRTSLGYVFFIIAPIMAGFLILSTPIIRLVYERGNFDAASTSLTSTAFFFYSFGMLGYGVQEIMNKAFYSLQDGKTPMRVAFLGIAVNISLSLLFVLGLNKGLGSLALAASISANITGFVLLYKLSKTYNGLINKAFLKDIYKIILSVIIMSVAVIAVYGMLKISLQNKFILAFAPSAIGVLVYFACCIVFRVEELTYFIGVLKTRLLPKHKTKDRG